VRRNEGGEGCQNFGTHECVFPTSLVQILRIQGVRARANEIKKHRSGDASYARFVLWHICIEERS
jgi:hypothetical protein